MKIHYWLILGAIGLVLLFMNKEKIENIILDAWSEKRLKSLHPAIRERVKKFLSDAAKQGINLRITSGLRTDEEQAQLYAKGRTAPGKIVTNARPGESLHNYGLAFDVVEMVDGQPIWDNPRWDEIGMLGQKYGFTWGGNWKFKDKPHFEERFGLQLTTLQQRKKDNNLTVSGYVNVS